LIFQGSSRQGAGTDASGRDGRHLGYEKNSVEGNNSGDSRNGSYTKQVQTEH